MLPVITLDDERFEEIMEKARKMIPGLYPEWTDYNYHDPGITMLEMLAWLKEVQQFHMDQIGQYHIRQYLKLLGVEPSHRKPAETLVSVSELSGSGTVLKGSRFLASRIPFELESERYLENTKISRILVTEASAAPGDEKSYEPGNGNLHISMFGRKPKAGAAFWIGFTSPLTVGPEHRLYFRMFHGYEVKRNPIGDSEKFVPLASVLAEYRTEDGFHSVKGQKDETCGFLEDGFLSFRLDQEMMPDEEGLYWLRIRLIKDDYDVAPVLEQVSVHTLAVSQMRTLSQIRTVSLKDGETETIGTKTFLEAYGEYEVYEETEKGWKRYEGTVMRQTEPDGVGFILPEFGFGNVMLVCFEEAFRDVRLLGQGDGFPKQEIETEITGLCAEGMELLIETSEESGVFTLWKRTEDFSNCGPGDCCYLFDEETGLLSFGDGIRGMVPEGRILLAAGHVSLGMGGNVKAGTIQSHETKMEFGSVLNREDAQGGQDPETLEQCQARLHRMLKKTERAVTYKDYEELTMRTPGLMIEKVRAIPASQRVRQDGTVDETRVTLVVKPFSADPMPRLGRSYVENIRNMLEPRRMIGTKLSILSPEYIGITIFAEIETDSHVQKVRMDLNEAFRRYFEHQGNEFGQPVLYGTIYEIIDVLEHVTSVRSISLDAHGNGIRRSRNGDILLPVNGLAYLKEWDCMISSAG